MLLAFLLRKDLSAHPAACTEIDVKEELPSVSQTEQRKALSPPPLQPETCCTFALQQQPWQRRAALPPARPADRGCRTCPGKGLGTTCHKRILAANPKEQQVQKRTAAGEETSGKRANDPAKQKGETLQQLRGYDAPTREPVLSLPARCLLEPASTVTHREWRTASPVNTPHQSRRADVLASNHPFPTPL